MMYLKYILYLLTCLKLVKINNMLSNQFVISFTTLILITSTIIYNHIKIYYYLVNSISISSGNVYF